MDPQSPQAQECQTKASLSLLGVPPTCQPAAQRTGRPAAWERPSWAACSLQDKLRGSQPPCLSQPGHSRLPAVARQPQPGGRGAEPRLRGLGKGEAGSLDSWILGRATACSGYKAAEDTEGRNEPPFLGAQAPPPPQPRCPLSEP